MVKKKVESVDDIVSGYQKFHHKTGKSFKERVKKFEEFNDPENIHRMQFLHHAHYIVFGKPTDLKGFPGAYNEAYKVLDRHVAEDKDKLEDEDKLAEILETYVDSFLQNAMGDKFKDILTHAKENGLKKKELKELKAQLMGQYYTDSEGKPINILSELYIKGLKGKKKIELIEELKNLSEKLRDNYSNHLQQKAVEGLISEEDRLDMAKYITPIFKKRGLKHEKPHITRSAREQEVHYSLLLQGATQPLIEKAGYKPTRIKKEEEKK